MNDIQTLMRSANPVPDAEQEFTDGDIKTLLTLTMTRSGEMQTQQTQEVEAPSAQRRKGWLVAAAAFAVVIIIGAAAFLSQQSDSVPPATSPAPVPTTAESAPTTVAEQTPTTLAEAPTTTLDAAEAEWIAQPPWRNDMNGEYRTNTFGTPFAFSTAGNEWGSQIQSADWLYIQSDFGGLDIFRVDGSLDQAVADWIQMHDSLENASMTEPEPITVGGATGFRFETVGLPRNVADIAESELVLFSANDGGVPAGPAGLVYVVDVEGQTVVLAFNDNIFDPAPGEIESRAAQAIAIIDSIVWKALR